MTSETVTNAEFIAFLSSMESISLDPGDDDLQIKVTYTSAQSKGIRGIAALNCGGGTDCSDGFTRNCFGVTQDSASSTISTSEDLSSADLEHIVLFPNIDKTATSLSDLPESVEISSIEIAGGKDLNPDRSVDAKFKLDSTFFNLCGYGDSITVPRTSGIYFYYEEYNSKYKSLQCTDRDMLGRHSDESNQCLQVLCNAFSIRDGSYVFRSETIDFTDAQITNALAGGTCYGDDSLDTMASLVESGTYTQPSPKTVQSSSEERLATTSLGEGKFLVANERIISPSGQYRAMLQGDNNFVIYSNLGLNIWASNTKQSCSSPRLFNHDETVYVMCGSERLYYFLIHNDNFRLNNYGNFIDGYGNNDPNAGVSCGDYYNHIIFYEGSGCTQDHFSFGVPRDQYSEYSITNSDNECFKNDEARSLKLRGPLPKNIRIWVGDSTSSFANDDSAVITLNKELASGSSICITSFETSTSNDNYSIYYNNVNGLNGKVSKARIEWWSTGWTNSMTKGLRWTPYFSEETPRSEYAGDGPIVGIHCAGSHCDNKKLLQAYSSTCRSSDYQWSSWYSEENGSWFNCGSGRYIGRFECSGSYCDNIRVACIKVSSSCSLSNTYSKSGEVKSTNTFECSAGQVLTGFKCHDRYCGRLELTCSTVTN